MAGIEALLLLLMMTSVPYASKGTVYDPAMDMDMYQDDSSAIMMRNGRPDMRVLGNLLEKQAAEEEAEELQEVSPPADQGYPGPDETRPHTETDTVPVEVDFQGDDIGEDETVGEEILNGPAKTTRKRFVANNKKKQWDFGILPYKFNTSIPAKQKQNILQVVMPKYEYWTHFRFVEWNSSVPARYNLSHQNYLFFSHEHGCWSLVGNTRRQKGGQKLSCCSGTSCVHEIGHAIGFFHEQQNPLSVDYIRINRQNIATGRAGNFGLKTFKGNMGFGYYDMSSLMEYGLRAFSKNKRQTISAFDPELEFLLRHHDTSAFYMFYEAETLYKMKDQKCPHFPLKCVNDGYVSYINNQCKCRCPTGLNPDTGCVTPTNADTWPKGAYSILKPQTGCPAGFTDGEVRLSVSGGTSQTGGFTSSQSYSAAGPFSTKNLTLSFCTKRYGHMPTTAPSWGPGRYCVVTSGTSCPSGFSEVTQRLGSSDLFRAMSRIGDFPNVKLNHTASIPLCCRTDGQTHTAMTAPTQKPFILFKTTNDGCQQVKGMTVEEQSISWTGHVGARTSQTTSQLIAFCYYTPNTVTMESPCGDTIFLSDINRTQTISSPLYPSQYTGAQACTWHIKVPPGSKVVMDVDDLSIHTKDGRSCNGHLEVRYMLPGQPGITYCGEGLKKTVVSHIDHLGLILTGSAAHRRRSLGPRFLLDPPAAVPSTAQTMTTQKHLGVTQPQPGATKRFRATVSLLRDEDLCYTNRGRDNSYQGKVNFGIMFERCVPWDRVTHCQHHTFNSVEFDLEGNYCRNPNSGTEPWCYTDAETCSRSYCDVCQIRKCYDVFADCAQLLKTNSQYCTIDPEAVRGCRQTCGLCHSVPKPSPVTAQTCGRPDPQIDGSPTMKLKDSYQVGEKVLYHCTGHPAYQRSRTCTSDGSWTRLAYTCGGCPVGWTAAGSKCFKKGQWTSLTKVSAASSCRHLLSGATLAVAETSQEANILHSMVHNTKIWLGGYKDVTNGKGQLVWDNGHSVNWTNWMKGKPWPDTNSGRNCLVMRSDTTWQNVACSFKNKFVCEVQGAVPLVCADQRQDCPALLARNPDMCQTYAHGFAHLKCLRSCGMCSQNQSYLNGHKVYPERFCPISGQPINASMVTKQQSIAAGSVVHYMCNQGYRLASGSLVRACLLSGNLTGSAPKCLDESDMTTDSNSNSLIRRSKVGATRRAYISSSPLMAINRTGEITAWKFYSNYGGQVALQVWRRVGNLNSTSFLLVGQNIIQDTKDGRQVTVDIARANRVTVKPGDFIGVYYSSHRGGIPYDDCKSQYTPSGGDILRVNQSYHSITEWRVGHHYSTRPDPSCHIFSLKAVIGPKCYQSVKQFGS